GPPALPSVPTRRSSDLYLVAQRRIGAVRTGSVFAAGPFIGAALAWLLGDRHAGIATGLAALAFASGVLLHLTERHAHGHVHPARSEEHTSELQSHLNLV